MRTMNTMASSPLSRQRLAEVDLVSTWDKRLQRNHFHYHFIIIIIFLLSSYLFCVILWVSWSSPWYILGLDGLEMDGSFKAIVKKGGSKSPGAENHHIFNIIYHHQLYIVFFLIISIISIVSNLDNRKL